MVCSTSPSSQTRLICKAGPASRRIGSRPRNAVVERDQRVRATLARIRARACTNLESSRSPRTHAIIPRDRPGVLRMAAELRMARYTGPFRRIDRSSAAASIRSVGSARRSDREDVDRADVSSQSLVSALRASSASRISPKLALLRRRTLGTAASRSNRDSHDQVCTKRLELGVIAVRARRVGVGCVQPRPSVGGAGNPLRFAGHRPGCNQQ